MMAAESESSIVLGRCAACGEDVVHPGAVLTQDGKFHHGCYGRSLCVSCGKPVTHGGEITERGCFHHDCYNNFRRALQIARRGERRIEERRASVRNRPGRRASDGNRADLEQPQVEAEASAMIQLVEAQQNAAKWERLAREMAQEIRDLNAEIERLQNGLLEPRPIRAAGR